jgi:hypothetical protein
MNISRTEFDSNRYDSEKVGNHTYGRYVFHSMDVYNIIKIENLELQAIYQNGISYYHEDDDCPSNELELSELGGSDKVLVKINEITETDFDNKKWINEILEEVKELCPVIDSLDKLKEVYKVLKDNQPRISDYVDDSEIDIDEDEDEDEDEDDYKNWNLVNEDEDEDY